MKNSLSIYSYIRHNTHKGFDELAYDLDLTKSQVKDAWNEMRLGWHMTPRTHVALTYLGEGAYELKEDIVVFIAPMTPMVVPKGLITDFASIPRWARWYISPDATWITVAALLHDVLYAAEWVDRKVADSIMYQVMKYRRANWMQRSLVYAAVRIGGGFTWRRHGRIMVEQYRQLFLARNSEYFKKKQVIAIAKKIV